MTSWASAFDSVTVAVECGGAEHHITWRRGALLLHDHDEKMERAFVALGGELPFCLEVLDTFRSPFEDPDALRAVLDGERVEATPFEHLRQFRLNTARLAPFAIKQFAGMPPNMPTSLQRARRLQLARDERKMRQECLPPELRVRAALGHLVRRRRRDPLDIPDGDGPPDDLMSLNGALNRVARRACLDSARTWHVRLPLGLENAIAPFIATSPAELHGYLHRRGGELYLQLPLSWIVDVWAAGLAVVDGWLVLGVERRLAPRRLRVRAVNWVIHRDGTIRPEEHHLTIGRWHGRWTVIAEVPGRPERAGSALEVDDGTGERASDAFDGLHLGQDGPA